jgi:hypothetical protein
MKLHHAVALAAIGWYLMVPPTFGDIVAGGAPISQWETIGSYETVTACNTDQKRKLDDVEKNPGEKALANVVWKQLVLALCIATDDPRLKGN